MAALAYQPPRQRFSSTGDAFEELSALIDEVSTRDRNEADTRHKIIDFILHDLLSWPRNRVAMEEYIAPGFADYVLTKSDGVQLLFIEAKREGVYFELPLSQGRDETASYISIGKLLTDESVKAAMTQVRTYCMDSGCEYACVTNGHEWVFFKIFEKGKKWESQSAFVIRNLSFFKKEYTKARNIFSFIAITENASLVGALTSSPPKDRGIHYPKERIPSYSHPIRANGLANGLRAAVNYYFGVIADTDVEFMERCYVSQQEYTDTTDGMRALIQDSISPYFEQYGVQQLESTGRGGQIGGRLTKSLKRGAKGEVLVLFGGKGAGKSTFIKRLLRHNPPPWLLEHAQICIVDLLSTPEDQEVIRKVIWDSLVIALDTNRLLDAPRDVLIASLFSDKHQVAQKQDLAGLAQNSEAYNVKLNSLVSQWKDDKSYCAKCLVNYWAAQNRGTIVVVDNTDQYSSAVQDYCFTSAQQIAHELGCVVLISMREERFYDSKIHGVLDAYQNAGFHISSPRPANVFRLRLEYVISLLTNPARQVSFLRSLDDQFVRDSTTYFRILAREFTSDTSPLSGFLSACAHGDIRLSLDLFRSFVLSGYTNVDEMISNGSWKFQIHQVIKPVMIPDRYFYDETLSNIPNIFQLRSLRHSSHFTGLRILRKLSKGLEKSAPAYHAVAELRSYFAETFNMVEDFERNIDVLLRHGFVESNNRLDAFSESVDSVKVTAYGLYMVRELAYYFTYLDLVCTDCGIFTEHVSNYLTEAAKTEYGLFMSGDRVERVRVRLERVEEFIKYLEAEELGERDLYSLGMPHAEMFTARIRNSFNHEKKRVMKSARRQEVRRGS